MASHTAKLGLECPQYISHDPGVRICGTAPLEEPLDVHLPEFQREGTIEHLVRERVGGLIHVDRATNPQVGRPVETTRYSVHIIVLAVKRQRSARLHG